MSPYFAPAFGFGGPPRSILALCQAQQVAGLDVQVFTTTADGEHRLPAAPGGTVYEGVPVRYFPTRGPGLLLWAPSLAAALDHASRSADVIHAHGLFNAPAWQAHRAATGTARPLVVSVRGMLEPAARAHHYWRKRAAWTLFDKRVCRDAALLHTTSARETASVKTVVPQAAVTEIPNAVSDLPGVVSDEARRAMRDRLNLGSHPYVLFLGRLHPIKRLDLLAAAFAVVARTHPGLRLVVAGDGDPRERARAESYLGEVRTRVIWAGRVEAQDREALLAEAATLVLCSDSENFGMSVAEALASGIPPVVTRTCPWEMLERESAGYWVEQSAGGIAGGIDRVLRNSDLSREMGRRGRRLAEQRFGPRAVGAAWVGEYARLAARARG